MGVIRSREDLTKAIKAACASQGVTVSKLGALLGMAQPSISRAVNRNDISISTLQRIGSALRCDLIVAFVPQRESGQPGAPSPASSPALPAADDLPGE